MLLRNGSFKLAKRVIDTANVEESLEVLDRLDVIVKREKASNNVGVQVIVAMPGQTSLAPPVIDAQPISCDSDPT